MGLRGKWWNNSGIVKQLGLTDAQIGQIENVFQHYRAQLMDLHSTLLQQEAVLEPLVEGGHPNVAQITAQIDKIAQARANLEKLNAQMLLAIRQALRADQWKQLRLRPGMRPPA
jgi:Spy/CpxP family protein refolding chaperone